MMGLRSRSRPQPWRRHVHRQTRIYAPGPAPNSRHAYGPAPEISGQRPALSGQLSSPARPFPPVAFNGIWMCNAVSYRAMKE